MTDDITQPTWAPDGSLVTAQPPDEEPMPDEPVLKEFIVTFDDETVMTFEAEDREHAIEQANDAKDPDQEVVSAEELDESDEPLPDPDDDGEDYSDILTPQEIRDGGAYRKDDKKVRYWLTAPQLAEFTRMDDKLDTDEEFWAWFKDFKEVNKLKADAFQKQEQRQRRGLVTPQWGDYWDQGKTKAKKYISDWWGGSSYYHYSGVSDETRRLAVALQAVQSTVRVVDNNVKRMRVQFTREDGGAPSSYTAYQERLISVSPRAILDKEIDEGEGIDITTGFALHEASHAEYSEPSLGALQKPTPMEPLAVAGVLHNLFEDIRIEQLTSNEFPGFYGYFEKGLAYLWPFVQEHAPEQWGPDLESKVNAIIAGVKWPIQYQPYLDKDIDFATEMQWWRDLSNSYAGGFRDMRETIELAMARLKEDPDTASEMEQMAKDEKDAQAAGEMAMPWSDMPAAVKDALKKWAENGGKIIEVCASPTHGETPPKEKDKKDVLRADLGDAVSELADSEMRIDKVRDMKIPELGNNPPDIVSLHPMESLESKAAWTPPLRGLVARMRNAFFFKPVAQQWTTRLQRSGSLDEDEVWRAAPVMGTHRDFRVFEQRNIESSPDTTITLLVDVSGSMGIDKCRTAVQAAAIMHEVLKNTPGVRVRLRAHTGDVDPVDRGQVCLYKIWESGESISRLGIPLVVRQGNNYDGYAIGFCVQEMLKEAKPEEQRLIIVLSDGQPHGYGKGGGYGGYGGEEAMAHVREVQTWARMKGVDVVQIAIDPAMDPVRQAKMFDNWVPFTTLEALPAQITAILKKAIK